MHDQEARPPANTTLAKPVAQIPSGRRLPRTNQYLAEMRRGRSRRRRVVRAQPASRSGGVHVAPYARRSLASLARHRSNSRFRNFLRLFIPLYLSFEPQRKGINCNKNGGVEMQAPSFHRPAAAPYFLPPRRV